MSDGKIRARQFWLYKALMSSECLVNLICKCFMCRLWKHAGKRKEKERKAVSKNEEKRKKTSPIIG